MLIDAYKLFLATLSNEKRLQIIDFLRNKPRTVTEIYKKLGFDQTTVSHNLRRLEKCGFVKVEKNGKERIYSLNSDTIEPLLKLIDRHTKNCCAKILKEKGGGKHG